MSTFGPSSVFVDANSFGNLHVLRDGYAREVQLLIKLPSRIILIFTTAEYHRARTTRSWGPNQFNGTRSWGLRLGLFEIFRICAWIFTGARETSWLPKYPEHMITGVSVMVWDGKAYLEPMRPSHSGDPKSETENIPIGTGKSIICHKK